MTKQGLAALAEKRENLLMAADYNSRCRLAAACFEIKEEA